MAGAELIGQEEIKEVMDVLETGVLMRYGFDKERKGVFKVRRLEEEFAQYCGVKYALGVTSGSSALKVALTAMDVGPGDEVLVPAFTFLATYEAVLEVGAIPVMCDIDDTLNFDPGEIEKKKTRYTKAVIPVHMCGSAAKIDKIMRIARKNKLMVLEDNAQGCGASFKGKKLGGFGDMGIFSFDYYKTLTTGEGGMVITNNKKLYLRSEWYSDHGHDHNPKVSRALEGRTILGFNYRMNELQGAVGLAQLRKLDYIVAEQKKNKAVIKEALARVPGVKFRTLPDPAGDSATFLAFNLPEEKEALKFQKLLSAGGLDTTCYKNNKWHYVPNWEHFLAFSTANSKKYPFADKANKGRVKYSRKSIPFAEDILSRTLVMGIAVRMSGERLGAITEAIENAAKNM
ncbi:MAG TPA: DegT/DnrJ/EryC1/StrS family aminotransferase [Smithellaceae bacterium]|jgi:8-amino-3,8-dideoxy-alpha-D-manno-octulosonate transaminase|nr:DegT/DnrJ/EryC1/StrS family aminotransferase [Smithellaceae bacterium]HOD64110.1 DegT/DnrJ/EryC1/StrS family aminotransferase [Smithellaceae bacterium]HOE23622.1 DegT/DnrJ/EryC1/StrS family aminotransferase [Smithellaceae bacterium]HPI52028.1 DegT/DnrJ/EryC1/StrS family aminotransferase [Smithellaceae bacterium]HPL32617.1 DegT/DnrJ/EryC1/StrS family aminotransferase [Smithellaceae bacterium]